MPIYPVGAVRYRAPTIPWDNKIFLYNDSIDELGFLNVWFWDKDSVEYEIFKQYERTLIAIGINFSREDIQDALESCTSGLEDAFRATISYIIWLQEQEKEILPDAILLNALSNLWKPRYWHDDYLSLPQFQSQGQKWYDNAAKIWGYDVRNQLVSDVFLDEGKEFIRFTNGKEMLVQIAWKRGWEEVCAFANSSLY